jgi:PAS domain S-box-containing protein
MSSKKHATTRSPVSSNRRKKVVGSARQRKPVSANRQELPTGGKSERMNNMLAAFFRFSPDAVIVVDEAGRITRVNDQVKSMFGYTSRELVGKRIEVLVPARFRGRHGGHRSRYMSAPRLREMGVDLDLYALRKDGSEFPADIMLSPVQTDQGRVVIATVRDVTEHKRVEEALRKSHEELETRVRERTSELAYATQTAVAAFENRARQQSAVAELSRRALEGRDLTSMLDDAVSVVTTILDVEFCKVLELVENALSLRAGIGWKEGSVGKVSLSIGMGSHGGFTLLSSSPVVVEDLKTETRFKAPTFFLEHGGPERC